jgi:hypothetical protein
VREKVEAILAPHGRELANRPRAGSGRLVAHCAGRLLMTRLAEPLACGSDRLHAELIPVRVGQRNGAILADLEPSGPE